MLNEPIKANNTQVKIFIGDEFVKVESEVNEWLGSQPEDIVVHDILYQHCFSAWETETSSGGGGMEREFSLLVVYGKGEVPF